MRKYLLLALLVLAVFVVSAGRLLVVNTPRKADAIVVLAGGRDDNRYYKGLELLRAGYAPTMFVDANEDVKHFGHPDTEYVQKFIQESAGADVARVKVCPEREDSTITESLYVARCLQADGAHSILLVTSDFHTRRALSVFQKFLPEYPVSVAAAPDVRFGTRWWQHREWAKMTLEEWEKLIFWDSVERWQSRPR